MSSNVNKPNMHEMGEDSPEYKPGEGGFLDRAGSTAHGLLQCKNVQRKVGNRTEQVYDHAPSTQGVPGYNDPRYTRVGEDKKSTKKSNRNLY